ncbi:MAG: hypothetical protein ACKO8I_19265, partial [Cyanobacteriota bacterium]
MSEPTFPTSPVFTNPADVPTIPNLPASAVDLTTNTSPSGGELGGINKEFTLTSTLENGLTQQVLFTGENNRLNASGGDANIRVEGGGAIIETAAVTKDDGSAGSMNIQLSAETYND